MVYLSSEGQEKNIFYLIDSDWHKTGSGITSQVLSYLEYSSLSNSAKSSLIQSLNRTLNVLAGVNYHLRNYRALEAEKRVYFRNNPPPIPEGTNERNVLVPELQCEIQGMLSQIKRGFESLVDLIKPVFPVPKDLTFGFSGERFLDVFQHIIIADIPDLKKHPVEKLIRLFEQGKEHGDTTGRKKKAWLKFLGEFTESAMRVEEPALVKFGIIGAGNSMKIIPPFYKKEHYLLSVLEKIWQTTLDFHIDFYALIIFWTLKPQYSFSRNEDAGESGRKWTVTRLT